MRALLLILVGVLVSSTADARPRRKKKDVATNIRLEESELVRPEPAKSEPVKPTKKKTRGQSVGAPWSGSLRNATRFKPLERVHLRRPYRMFATRTTIQHTRRVIKDVLADFPKLHELAMGDFSAESGGRITEHHSHQSGRDVDIGLFYKSKPAGYPAGFVDADAKTLDARAMWRMISKLDKTRDDDGGVLMMFLDFDLQGVIYKWAKANGASEERLDRIFQWPHGRGSSAGLVRHEPNHNNHLHVRFQCAEADAQCR
jgi:hypothetical protein